MSASELSIVKSIDISSIEYGRFKFKPFWRAVGGGGGGARALRARVHVYSIWYTLGGEPPPPPPPPATY